MTASQLAAGRARQTAGSDQHEGVDVDAVTPGNRSSERSEVCVWDLLDLSTADNLALHIGNLLCECEEHYYQRMLQAGDVAASPVEPVYWPQCAAWRALALVRAEPLAVPDPSSAFVLDDARWHVRLAPAGALLGNENYLVLLLENLLRNAQFFSRKRGYRSPFASIAVILTEQDGHACLRVYNRGPHIPEGPPQPVSARLLHAPQPRAPGPRRRLRRVFDIDISNCPCCGGTLRVIGDVTDPDVISRILEHLRCRGECRVPPAGTSSHTPDLMNTAG